MCHLLDVFLEAETVITPAIVGGTTPEDGWICRVKDKEPELTEHIKGEIPVLKTVAWDTPMNYNEREGGLGNY